MTLKTAIHSHSLLCTKRRKCVDRVKSAGHSIVFDDEKLGALEFSLRKEHSSVQEHLEDALNALYEKTVPEPLREYLDSKAAPAAVKPKRPVKPAAPKPQSSEPKPAAVKEGN